MDLMPTFADLAGIKLDHEIDGESLVPIWLEGKKGDSDRTLIWVRREEISGTKDVATMRFGKENGNFCRIIPSSRCS